MSWKLVLEDRVVDSTYGSLSDLTTLGKELGVRDSDKIHEILKGMEYRDIVITLDRVEILLSIFKAIQQKIDHAKPHLRSTDTQRTQELGKEDFVYWRCRSWLERFIAICEESLARKIPLVASG